MCTNDIHNDYKLSKHLKIEAINTNYEKRNDIFASKVECMQDIWVHIRSKTKLVVFHLQHLTSIILEKLFSFKILSVPFQKVKGSLENTSIHASHSNFG